MTPYEEGYYAAQNYTRSRFSSTPPKNPHKPGTESAKQWDAGGRDYRQSLDWHEDSLRRSGSAT